MPLHSDVSRHRHRFLDRPPLAPRLKHKERINRKLPIHRLPFEILSMIFLVYVDSFIDEKLAKRLDRPTFGRSPGSTTSPMLLTMVCGRWKDIALSTPALWSSIYIYDPLESYVNLTKLWLERVGDAPLDLTLRCTSPANYSAYLVLRRFMDHTRQWRRIEFQIPRSVFDGLKTIKRPLPILESAFIYPNNDDYSPDLEAKRILDCIYASPRLRGVTWLGPYSLPMDPTAYYPRTLSQLTTMALFKTHTCIHDIFKFLSACHELQVLVIKPIRGRICAGPGHNSLHSIVHRRLKSLQMEGIKQDLGKIFQHLALPALESLILIVDHDPTPMFQRLPDFLNRSKCRLLKFDLRTQKNVNYNVQEADLLRFFTCPSLHSLTKLAIYQERITSACIMFLNLDRPVHPRYPIMPNLVDLELYDCMAEDGVLGNMILSRCRDRVRFQMLDTVFLGRKNSFVNGHDDAILKHLFTDYIVGGWQRHEDGSIFRSPP